MYINIIRKPPLTIWLSSFLASDHKHFLVFLQSSSLPPSLMPSTPWGCAEEQPVFLRMPRFTVLTLGLPTKSPWDPCKVRHLGLLYNYLGPSGGEQSGCQVFCQFQSNARLSYRKYFLRTNRFPHAVSSGWHLLWLPITWPLSNTDYPFLFLDPPRIVLPRSLCIYCRKLSPRPLSL